MRKIFPIFTILWGLLWIIYALDYGLWIRRGPGGGFFPLIGGLLTVAFSIAFLADDLKSPMPAVVDRKFVYPILTVLGVVLCSGAIGFMPSLFIYILLWLWRYEKRGLSQSFLVALGTTVVLYLVFVYWLAVPLPRGLLGEGLI